MKKLSMLCMCVLVLGLVTAPAMAQKYEVDIMPADGTFDTTASILPGEQICFEVWLTGADTATAQPTAGGVYVDYTGAVGQIAYVSAAGALPPWLSELSNDEPDGPGTFWIKLTNPFSGTVDDGAGNIKVAELCFDCTGGGDADIRLCAGLCDGTGATYWGPNPPYDDLAITPATSNPTLTITQICECLTDSECDNGDFCDGVETCDNCACIDGTPPCDDGDPCTLDCDEDTDTCTDPVGSLCDEAYAVNNKGECCLEGEICNTTDTCAAGATLIKEDGFYQPPAEGEVVTIKNRICLDNPSILVGGIQFDLCDDPDCLECIDCELTERTVMFDCVVLELPDGCCRVIMFCKNPGCAINPGLCNIVTIVMQTKEGAPEECGEDCIDESFTNIVVSDYDGFSVIGSGQSGELCPIACGDVCPPGSGIANDCGDGVVDIYDIMCEVDFALTATTPNDCQLPRADVPTGTPPNCTAPDGSIDILDIMVLIDMALNRQDCCSFYYLGIIY